MPFATEKITSYTNEAAKVANKAGKNPPSCVFVSGCTVSVMPSVNIFESSNNFMILKSSK